MSPVSSANCLCDLSPRIIGIKFCGLTRAEDVNSAIELGADAMGFVLVPASKRYVRAEQVVPWLRQKPTSVRSVALFQNAEIEQVRTALAYGVFDLLQFHGRESGAFCRQFGMPYLKAVPMGDAVSIAEYEAEFSDAEGLLLDAHSLNPHGAIGGTGHRFDWSDASQQLQTYRPRSLWLAGGLDADNVLAAITELKPSFVDVSSGIEASPGIKDHDKMRQFISNARRQK